MKNRKESILVVFITLVISGGIYSFTSLNSKDKEPLKRMEVIRMSNGEMQTFDTVIEVNSSFSPTDYLNQLGFKNDSKVNIINLMEHPNSTSRGISQSNDQKMIFIEVNEEIEEEMVDGKVVKRIVKSDVISNEDVDNNFVLQLDIDSIVAAEISKNPDAKFEVQKIEIVHELSEGDEETVALKSKGIDESGAIYHKEINEPGKFAEVAVWGENEDFTLVIVSEAPKDYNKSLSDGQKHDSSIKFELFPNPTNATTQLSLFFKDQAKTTLSVIDVNGKLVDQIDLGEIMGDFQHQLHTQDWEKGVYLIKIDHGNEQLIEKLIVQ